MVSYSFFFISAIYVNVYKTYIDTCIILGVFISTNTRRKDFLYSSSSLSPNKSSSSNSSSLSCINSDESGFFFFLPPASSAAFLLPLEFPFASSSESSVIFFSGSYSLSSMIFPFFFLPLPFFPLLLPPFFLLFSF